MKLYYIAPEGVDGKEAVSDLRERGFEVIENPSTGRASEEEKLLADFEASEECDALLLYCRPVTFSRASIMQKIARKRGLQIFYLREGVPGATEQEIAERAEKATGVPVHVFTSLTSQNSLPNVYARILYAYHLKRDAKLPIDEIAKRVGRSRPRVSQYLREYEREAEVSPYFRGLIAKIKS